MASIDIGRNTPCPCGSGSKYKRCCGPPHEGASPSTAASLVRARFTAYVVGKWEFIIATTHGESPHRRDDEAVWSNELKTYGSRATYSSISIDEETTGIDEAWITYTVHLDLDGHPLERAEQGYFKRVDGRWFFVYGLRRPC